ncbi:HupE/UreJ family protein [Photobacterium leiognathi]|uniref:HupE/UreJ family protein n=1 Tax=Photobacterium leiognathi TaxID=553611 RepID=UPI0029813919|nr:HupE/UreJ family protein [Photobacterium leiognathi]
MYKHISYFMYRLVIGTVVSVMLSVIMTPLAMAHPYQPSVGLITQLDNQQYKLALKLPMIAGEHTQITPTLTNGGTVRLLSSQRSDNGFGMDEQDYLLQLKANTSSPTLVFNGLKTGQLLTQLTLKDGQVSTLALYQGHNRLHLTDKISIWTTIKLFVTLGITHILTGIDHLMFVAGLLLFTRDFKTFLKAITCFTLAHSITLSLSALNLVHIPEPPVETGIALSILFLCYELTRPYDKQHPTLSRKFPWLISFSFGLLHGLGFASALKEVGLSQTSIPLALACFNVGVEIGQLIFLSFLIVLLKLCAKVPVFHHKLFQKVPLYTMGIMASFWFIQRAYIMFHVL